MYDGGLAVFRGNRHRARSVSDIVWPPAAQGCDIAQNRVLLLRVGSVACTYAYIYVCV